MSRAAFITPSAFLAFASVVSTVTAGRALVAAREVDGTAVAVATVGGVTVGGVTVGGAALDGVTIDGAADCVAADTGTDELTAPDSADCPVVPTDPLGAEAGAPIDVDAGPTVGVPETPAQADNITITANPVAREEVRRRRTRPLRMACPDERRSGVGFFIAQTVLAIGPRIQHDPTATSAGAQPE